MNPRDGAYEIIALLVDNLEYAKCMLADCGWSEDDLEDIEAALTAGTYYLDGEW